MLRRRGSAPSWGVSSSRLIWSGMTPLQGAWLPQGWGSGEGRGWGRDSAAGPRCLPHLRLLSDSPGASLRASLGPQGSLGRNPSLGSGCHGAWPPPPPSFLLQSLGVVATGTADRAGPPATGLKFKVWPPAPGGWVARGPAHLVSWEPQPREVGRDPQGPCWFHFEAVPSPSSLPLCPPDPHFLGNAVAASSELNLVNPESTESRLPDLRLPARHTPPPLGLAERPSPDSLPSRRFWAAPAHTPPATPCPRLWTQETWGLQAGLPWT